MSARETWGPAWDSSSARDAESRLAKRKCERIASGRSLALPAAGGVPDRDVLTRRSRHLRRRGLTPRGRGESRRHPLASCWLCRATWGGHRAGPGSQRRRAPQAPPDLLRTRGGRALPARRCWRCSRRPQTIAPTKIWRARCAATASSPDHRSSQAARAPGRNTADVDSARWRASRRKKSAASAPKRVSRVAGPAAELQELLADARWESCPHQSPPAAVTATPRSIGGGDVRIVRAGNKLCTSSSAGRC